MADPKGQRVRGLALELGEPPQRLWALAADALGVPVDTLAEVRPHKVSLDARGATPKRVYQVDVWRVGEDVPPATPPEVTLPSAGVRPLVVGEAPVIVGTGPAGLWAALTFLRAGQPSILVERGGAVETRNRKVHALRTHGELDPESNLCFGEGGSGTYSDGKLYTRIKNPGVRRVYEDLVAFGAPAEILVDAHPHVGTNKLVKLLRQLRRFLVASGCEMRFDARVVELLRTAGGGVGGVRLADGTELTSPATVLATGHSARDVYALLRRHGAAMARKSFAIGARIEHPQALIDQIQYGRHAEDPRLEAAAYAVTAKVSGRGIYSFCMCPGGYVIPTTTELGHVNVNGMSNARRGSPFANSALVVTLEPDDFWLERPGDLDAHGPLAGVALQRAMEARAFEAAGGGYRAPSQRVTDFLEGRDGDLPSEGSYRPGTAAADLRDVLPRRVTDPLARALYRFDEKLRGFVTAGATLIGVETTTSSPVRVARDPQTLAAAGLPGLYPAGEGAGYAGGIVSSALEGARVAEAILAVSSVPGPRGGG